MGVKTTVIPIEEIEAMKALLEILKVMEAGEIVVEALGEEEAPVKTKCAKVAKGRGLYAKLEK